MLFKNGYVTCNVAYYFILKYKNNVDSHCLVRLLCELVDNFQKKTAPIKCLPFVFLSLV